MNAIAYLGGPLDDCVGTAPPSTAQRAGYRLVTGPGDPDGLAVWEGDDPSAAVVVVGRATAHDPRELHVPAGELVGDVVSRLVEDVVAEGAHPGSLTVRVRSGDYGLVAEVHGYKPAPYAMTRPRLADIEQAARMPGLVPKGAALAPLAVAMRSVLDVLDRADAKPGPEGERKVNTVAVRAALDEHIDLTEGDPT